MDLVKKRNRICNKLDRDPAQGIRIIALFHMSPLSDDRKTIAGLLNFRLDVFVIISVGIAEMVNGMFRRASISLLDPVTSSKHIT